MVRSKVWKAITFKAENLYTLVLNFFWQAEVSVPMELLPGNIWDIRSVWTDERAYELPRVFETSACLKHHEANFLLIITSIVSQTVEWNHLQIRARRSRLRHHRDALAAAILPIRIYLVLQRRPLQIFSWLLKALPKPSGLIAKPNPRDGISVQHEDIWGFQRETNERWNYKSWSSEQVSEVVCGTDIDRVAGSDN